MPVKSSLFKDCNVVNEDPGHYSINDDELIIETSCGSMWGKGNTCKNLFLFPAIMKDLSIDVVVTFLPENNGEQAGLVLYRDSDNYIKLVREMVDHQHVVVLAKEIHGNPETIMMEEVSSAEVKLRIDVDHKGIGLGWKVSGSVEEQINGIENWLGHGADVKVGLLVHGRNKENKAKFSSFNIKS